MIPTWLVVFAVVAVAAGLLQGLLTAGGGVKPYDDEARRRQDAILKARREGKK